MSNTQKMQELLENWNNAMLQKKSLEEKQWKAVSDVLDTEAALAKFLAPEDMKNGEQICIWVNVEALGDPKKERLLFITKKPPRQGETESYYEVKFR